MYSDRAPNFSCSTTMNGRRVNPKDELKDGSRINASGTQLSRILELIIKCYFCGALSSARVCLS